MMKILNVLFFVVGSCMCAQNQSYTIQQAQTSDDPRVVATFIKANPEHPQTPELKRRLVAIVNNTKSDAEKASTAKPSVKPLTSGTVKQGTVSPKGDAHAQKTADLLNHLFNSDPTSKTAYIQITNKSKCNLIVKISGKKFYNLTVPANNQNFILVDKGTYTLSSSICDAKYSSTKNITQDIAITLKK